MKVNSVKHQFAQTARIQKHKPVPGQGSGKAIGPQSPQRALRTERALSFAGLRIGIDKGHTHTRIRSINRRYPNRILTFQSKKTSKNRVFY